MDELTKQISAENKSSLVSLEIITEYNNSIGKKSLKQLTYLGISRSLVFLHSSGMSIRIQK